MVNVLTNCEFVLEEMSSDLKIEILNGLISLTSNLGFSGHYGHTDVRGTFSVFLFSEGGTITFTVRCSL